MSNPRTLCLLGYYSPTDHGSDIAAERDDVVIKAGNFLNVFQATQNGTRPGSYEALSRAAEELSSEAEQLARKVHKIETDKNNDRLATIQPRRA